jgi:hypothetical protein
MRRNMAKLVDNLGQRLWPPVNAKPRVRNKTSPHKNGEVPMWRCFRDRFWLAVFAFLIVFSAPGFALQV